MPRQKIAMNVAQGLLLTSISVFIVAMYSSWRRPIWYDEWLQFLWGAHPFELQTMTKILEANQFCVNDAYCNVGQTGVYMMIHNGLLNFFGAEELALRTPSYLAALLMFWFVIMFFRVKGLGFLWQIVGVLAVASSSFYMFYIGEARPYLPLAAAAAGIAVYYSSSLEERKAKAVAVIGWVAGIGGSLLHPFTAPYLIAIALTFAALYASGSNDFGSTRRQQFVRAINAPLVLTCVSIWLFFYLFGWGQNLRDNGFTGKIYLYVPESALWQTYFSHIFGQRNFSFSWISLIGIAILLVGIFYVYKTNSLPAVKLAAPLILFILGAALGAGTITINIATNSWIMPRYWIASYVWVILSLVWAIALMTQSVHWPIKPNLIQNLAVPGLLSVALAAFLVPDVRGQFTTLREYEVRKNEIGLAMKAAGISSSREILEKASNLEEAANFNLYLGGPVSPSFRKIYDGHLELKRRVCPDGCRDRTTVLQRLNYIEKKCGVSHYEFLTTKKWINC